MKLLLDTHVFLWHVGGDPQLSAGATALLTDPANELFLSAATLWEIAIKSGLQKTGFVGSLFCLHDSCDHRLWPRCITCDP